MRVIATERGDTVVGSMIVIVTRERRHLGG